MAIVDPLEEELRPNLYTMWGVIGCGICLFDDEAVYDTFGRQDESAQGEEVGRISWINRPDKGQLHNRLFLGLLTS